ncbi:FtsX-like permease family protein [Streptomyces sp. NPDC053499]|uniref:ABC transporter permease n=1 Tax=Streptomyces sp. NPDC053499 TaxID=3365707 RepID=UPI0037D61428
MRATARWVRADLRAHRGEALFLVLATAGVIVSLLLSGAFLAYGASPWQRVFTESTGAHVWIQTTAGADAKALAGLDGVESASGPFRTAVTTVELDGAKARVQLRAAGAEPPKVARPLMTEGRWPEQKAPAAAGAASAHARAGAAAAHAPAEAASVRAPAEGPAGADSADRDAAGAVDGIVLESSLARALWAEPGDVLHVRGSDGAAHALRVSGVAETAEDRYSPGRTPGIGWVLPGAMHRLGTEADQRGQTIGLRLDDPEDTDFAIQRAVTELGDNQIVSVSTWQQARDDAEGGGRLLGLLLGLFGLSALLAAALAVAGAISTRIRGHLRDIAILKAIGFTPGQLIRTFLVEHAALALLGVACGAVLTEVLGPRMPGRLGEAMRLWQALPAHTWVPLAIPLGALLLIVGTTALAAWRAGRVSPVPVARAAMPAVRRMPGTVRRALGLRLPPALVLGWRGAFHSRARSCAAVGRLAVPLLLITIVLGAWTTLDRLEHHPERAGIPAALTVRGDGLDAAAVRGMLADQPKVTAAYPGDEVKALVPGQTGTITLRGLGTDRDPYPFTIAEGRAADRSHEAVAGQGLLDLLDVRVGDWVRVTVGGDPQVLHIVGRSIEPEEDGRVLSTPLDTLREGDSTLSPGFYNLVLDEDADPAAVAAELSSGADGRLDVREIPNPVQELHSVRGVLGGLVTVLALIGLAELSTTIAAGVRERRRDLLALKAIGLTPRQIIAVIVAGTGFTALAAALVGTAAGVIASGWLIDLQGRSSGIGAGIAQQPPPAALLLLVAAVVAGAVAVSLLPASRAVRQRLADTLGDSL